MTRWHDKMTTGRSTLSVFAVVVILAAISDGDAVGAAGLPKVFEGNWGTTIEACRDPDGADGLTIQADSLQWYETRCHANGIDLVGPRDVVVRLACEGEGRRYRARSSLSLSSSGKLIIDHAPVGRTRKETYVRCRR